MSFVGFEDFTTPIIPININTDIEETSLSTAQDLLYMPNKDDYNYDPNTPMSGYTVTAAEYFKDVGEYDQTPHKGDIVYFNDSTGIAHVGIVEEVTENGFTTIEGNTSIEGFDSNGRAVARKEYTFDQIGGRVDGFGHPNFEATGITADEFVAKAQSYIGYNEKDSADYDLDDFEDGAGTGNYTKFELDVNGTNGSFWCQYFVDFCAKDASRDMIKNRQLELIEQEKLEQEQQEIEEIVEDNKENISQHPNIDKLIENANTKDSNSIFEDISITDLRKEISELDGDPTIIEMSDLTMLQAYLNENCDKSFDEIFNQPSAQSFLDDIVGTIGESINNVVNNFDENNLTKDTDVSLDDEER